MNIFGKKRNNKVNFKENYNLKWTIWDTAGQERFRSLINTYFRNRTIYFIIYDFGGCGPSIITGTLYGTFN